MGLPLGFGRSYAWGAPTGLAVDAPMRSVETSEGLDEFRDGPGEPEQRCGCFEDCQGHSLPWAADPSAHRITSLPRRGRALDCATTACKGVAGRYGRWRR